MSESPCLSRFFVRKLSVKCPKTAQKVRKIARVIIFNPTVWANYQPIQILADFLADYLRTFQSETFHNLPE